MATQFDYPARFAVVTCYIPGNAVALKLRLIISFKNLLIISAVDITD